MPLPPMTPEAQAAYEHALKRIEACRRKGEQGTSLVLTGIGLSQVPPEIGQLSALTALHLADNELTGLPPEIGKLPALALLFLRNNQLTSLPSEIGKLSALTELNLFNNQLTSLPSEIGELSALTVLILSNNQLTSLPQEISKLSALTTLVLDDAKFDQFPEDLRFCANLERISMQRSRLTSLPAWLKELKHLTHLMLLGNVMLSIPQEILREPEDDQWCEPNAQRVLDYYFSRQEQGEAPMQEVRLLMVGRGRVGKTSLLNVLRGASFNQKEVETPGITVLPLDLSCAQGTARAHAWDFGGQEFLHGTHQIFLSERCVYVLVLEGREGSWEVETDYWLRFIQSYGGDSPVIVALNKHDEHAFSVDRFRLQERCPQIVGFVETDALTKRGIPELRAMLARTVNEMPHVWIGVPKKWHRIKEALAAMAQSFVCYQDYQALCVSKEVTEERQQDSLAQTLHRLGIALNFRDHHRLRHTSVLKPQWVTEGIYGLLRFAQSKECHGVLNQAMITQALPMKDYPPSTHEFVMELMEKFEVAFPLEPSDKQQKPTRWLIPELLPEVQPAPFAEFRGEKVRRLRFAYPEALPPGLLPRLIVRTHEMSSAHPDWRWRGGVVLEWNGCQALVRLDRQQRQTTVEVMDGPPDAQQSLFDLIRAELEVLHGKVRVVEEVELPGHPGTWIDTDRLRLLEQNKTSETLEATKEKQLTKVQVTPTLNAVESQEARDASQPDAPKRMRLFVSYAHDDARKLKPLSTHLKILGRRGYIQVWDDKQLVAGEEWKERITAELNQADIVLMLYSTASRASDFIQDTEGPMAVKLSQARACRLIVAPLDRKDWDEHAPLEQDLKKLQTASWNAKPVLEFSPQTKGWEEVEQAIRKVVLALRKSAPMRLPHP